MNIKEIFNNESLRGTTNIIEKVTRDFQQDSLYLEKYILALEENYTATKATQEVYLQLLRYFTGNTHLQAQNRNGTHVENKVPLRQDKGIWLVGQVGSGKSLLMDVFGAYTGEILRKNSFVPVDFERIVKKYIAEGEKAIDEFNFLDPTSSQTRPKTLYIDDFMNVKYEVKSWGELGNVAESILNTRYRIFKRHRKLTHVTTNIYPRDLASKGMDERIVSRCAEMFNIIELTGQDWRKIK